MITTRTFFLTFNSNLGETVSLTIPRADSEMTAPEVAQGMDALIATDIILTKNGKPVSIRGARRVTRGVEDLELV
ncbi:MAG: DUF2922 domain-containing protein [Defluviitaleaceae bacterium]|nr:DUF2922 domain-containing protein [Defluviitaleaceae bacterium]